MSIGDYYDRIEIERKAIARAFAKLRVMAGEGASAERIFAMMREIEHETGDTGD